MASSMTPNKQFSVHWFRIIQSKVKCGGGPGCNRVLGTHSASCVVGNGSKATGT